MVVMGISIALDIYSGKLIWKYKTNGERKYDFADYFHSSPVLTKGVLFFGSGDPIFYAINSKDAKFYLALYISNNTKAL